MTSDCLICIEIGIGESRSIGKSEVMTDGTIKDDGTDCPRGIKRG
jgi:hypothetical protein